MSIQLFSKQAKHARFARMFALLPICAAAFTAGMQEASAHGAIGTPIARQYQCRLEGGYWDPADGSGIAHTDCRAAYQNGGNSAYPFTQWNEFSANPISQGDDLEKLQQAVPDGLLCAGGDKKKSGIDVPAVAWRKTRVTPVGGKIDVTWENTQSHTPSVMRIYLSKPGYNPQQPLRWADLDKIYDAPAPAPQPAQRRRPPARHRHLVLQAERAAAGRPHRRRRAVQLLATPRCGQRGLLQLQRHHDPARALSARRRSPVPGAASQRPSARQLAIALAGRQS